MILSRVWIAVGPPAHVYAVLPKEAAVDETIQLYVPGCYFVLTEDVIWFLLDFILLQC